MRHRPKFMIIVAVVLIGSIPFASNIFGSENLSKEDKIVPDILKYKVAVINEPLPLRLLGTIVESNETKSIAVIRNINSQKQYIYKVGDMILDFQVARIYRGKAVLLKNGKLYLLEFPLGREFEPITVISSDKRIVNRSALAKKIPDLTTAARQAVAIPHIESGKVIGFKITNIKNKELAKLAGLQEGDVVTKVNGQSLDSLKKPFEIYHNIRQEEKIDVEIKRGKEIKSLTYYIN